MLSRSKKVYLDFFLTTIFLTIVIKNFIEYEYLRSFGDTFFLFNEKSLLNKISSFWIQSDFGYINNRNLFSLLIFLKIKAIFFPFENLNHVLFQNVYITFLILISAISLIKLYNFLLKLSIKGNYCFLSNRNNYQYFFLISFFFLNPFILQFIINIDITGLPIYLLTPTLLYLYLKFVLEIRFKYFLYLFILYFLIFTGTNNILIFTSAHFIIVPFFLFYLIQSKSKLRFLSINIVYIFLLIGINYVNFTYAIYGILSNLNSNNIANVDLEFNKNWFNWMSSNSSFLNIFKFQNYPAWSSRDGGIRLLWNFYDLYKYSLVGIIFTFFYIIPLIIIPRFKNFLKIEFRYLYLYLSIFIFLIAFLAKGSHEPFSFLNKILFDKIIFIAAYRTTFYFSISLITIFTILVAISINLTNISLNIRNKSLHKDLINITLILIISFITYNTYFKKNFLGNFFKFKIPSDLIQTVDHINHDKYLNNRILVLPKREDYRSKAIWKANINGSIFFHLINNELIENNVKNLNAEIIEKLIQKKYEKENLIKVFNFLGINQILFRKDLAELYNGIYKLITIDEKEYYLYQIFEDEFDTKLFSVLDVNLESKIIEIPKEIIHYND